MEQFCEDTTLHGIRYVSSSKRHVIQRIFWGLFLVGMFSAFTTQFILSIVKFYDYETYTSIQIKSTTELQMPSITICNQNLIKASVMQQLLPDAIDDTRSYTLFLHGVYTGDQVSLNPKFGLFSLIDTFTDAGHTLEETFVHCSLYYSTINCSDFIQTHLTDAGLCYTFHSKEYIEKHGGITIRQPGTYYSFQLVLDVLTHEYLFTLNTGAGFVIKLHDPNVFPFLVSNTFTVAPGNQINVLMKKEITTILKPPYTNTTCIDEDDLFRQGQERGYAGKYSQEECMSKCFISLFYNCPHCKAYSYGPDQCSLYDSLKCSEQGRLNIQDSYNERTCNCPPKCTTTNFVYQLSSTDFPNPHAVEMAKALNWSTSDPNVMQERYLQLRFFYDSLSYTQTDQFAVLNIIQLISNFGGQMGLYLGASLITLFEFCDFFVFGLISKIQSKQKQTITVVSPTTDYN